MREEPKKNTIRLIRENLLSSSTCQSGTRHLLEEMNFHFSQLTKLISKPSLFYLWTGNHFKRNHSCAHRQRDGISHRLLAPSYEK